MKILVFRANYARSKEDKLRLDNVDGYVKTVAHSRLREQTPMLSGGVEDHKRGSEGGISSIQQTK